MEIMFKEENSGIFSGTGARAWVLHYEEPEKKQDGEDAEEDVLAAAADTADTDPEDICVIRIEGIMKGRDFDEESGEYIPADCLDAALQYVAHEEEARRESGPFPEAVLYRIRYMDGREVPEPKKIGELERKIGEWQKKTDAFVASHSVKKHKAKNISCRACGSSVNKEYVTEDAAGRHCPVCGADMRPESDRKAIKSLTDRKEKWEEELAEARKRHDRRQPCSVAWVLAC